MQEDASLEIMLASIPSSQEVHSTSSQTLSRQIATGFAVSNKPTTIRRKIWPMSCAHPCHAFQLQNELCNTGFTKFPLCLAFSFTFLILYMIKIRFHEGERRQEWWKRGEVIYSVGHIRVVLFHASCLLAQNLPCHTNRCQPTTDSDTVRRQDANKRKG